MRSGVALLLGALVLALGLDVAWLRPEWLPLPAWRHPGPGYAEVHDAWDALLRAKRLDAALDLVDEYLLEGVDVKEYGSDARAMRLLTVKRGGVGPLRPEDRPLAWRLERLAARRPAREWAVAVAALALGLAGLTLMSRHRPPSTPPPPEVLGPRPHPEKLVEPPPVRRLNRGLLLGPLLVACGAGAFWAGLEHLQSPFVHGPALLVVVGAAAALRGVARPLVTVQRA
ncbi:MAG: hypothetical protein M9894_06635 [Planctomycetes bacterium]|nr:hypothetical protein [Planctomycetota bacterium]